MAFSWDSELAALIEAVAAARADLPPPPPRGDAVGLREATNPLMAAMAEAVPHNPAITRTSHSVTSHDGAEIALHWFAKTGSSPGSAVLYVHGGGMICGSVDLYVPIIEDYVATSGVPMLAVSYRLAPEFPHPTPVEDAFAGLKYLFDHAGDLGVDPARIAVLGDSAGGGVAAGVALLARDRGLALKRQMLVYPMLDDRNIIPDPELEPFAGWTYDNNFTGWSALLGDALGSDDVPEAAAPARAKDLTGIAPAYVECGELDIFRDEDIEYARRIAAAGSSIELHIHPGAPHGFERLGAGSDVANRAMADRYRVLGAL
ncbi:MAG: alpha/beta hydrolase [Novosphingobium sp.]|nr:alpha/beta hydrolase [Novosphingobium sp.]